MYLEKYEKKKLKLFVLFRQDQAQQELKIRILD